MRQDGQAVALTLHQYRYMEAGFVEASRPINRRLRWRFTLAIPVLLLTLSLLSATRLSHAIDHIPVPGLPFLVSILTIIWWPLLALLLHWRAMRRLDETIEAMLMRLPLAPAPPAPPRALHMFQIIAIFLVGPGLLIDIVGSLFPRIFDNTPFTDRAIGLSTVLGLLLFVVLMRPLLRRSLKKHPARQADKAPEADAPARMSAIAARARAAKQP